MAKVLIIGGGAAGLFAAGVAKQNGHDVVVIEHMDTVGKKLLITGKGRCNVTNNCDEKEFLQNIRHNPKFLYSAIYAMPPAAVMQVFETYGVPLKTERGRRVFPESDKAEDVLNALLEFGKGAKILHKKAEKLLINEGACTGAVLSDGSEVLAGAVIVATGGVSYPATGSTGIGYALAKQAGHSIKPPMPSLVSMVEKGRFAAEMMGLSLKNVKLTLLENRKPVFSEMGEMLFTHFGISGPLVLSASAYLGDMNKKEYVAAIDLKPALDEEKLDERIRRDFEVFANKDVSQSLDKLLPKSMRDVMLSRWRVQKDKKVNQITKQERMQLVQLIKSFEIEIAQRGDLNHAVITAGGVCVKQIEPKTMQSKLAKNLYFAGEVLDVDGYTGGYNLQIAWATAAAAANAIK